MRINAKPANNFLCASAANMALSFYWLRHFVAAFCLIAYCTTAHSENRALLIGATSYEKELFNLSGIDKDLTTMKQFARLLGYQDGQIKTLAGPESRRAGSRHQQRRI